MEIKTEVDISGNPNTTSHEPLLNDKINESAVVTISRATLLDIFQVFVGPLILQKICRCPRFMKPIRLFRIFPEDLWTALFTSLVVVYKSTEEIADLLGVYAKKVFHLGSYAMLVPDFMMKYHVHSRKLEMRFSYEVFNPEGTKQWPLFHCPHLKFDPAGFAQKKPRQIQRKKQKVEQN
eukprot:TRINITY_DN3351_c0_g1_i1.p1 TRINITY_DN3351_c0_g1~~TRINITY_DN3351_c0_g1_i1.p1  ORF type:complete len:179 (-),score=24.67 TRINITY_DN3351_c0_g1_i1:302-838(-)